MSFKDVLKDTIKIGGCMGLLVASGGYVALKAYRSGYLDAYRQAMSIIDIAVEREVAKVMDDSR